MQLSLRARQTLVFSVGWLAYGSSYLIRKPLGVIKADLEKELSFTKHHLGWLDTALLLPYAVMQVCATVFVGIDREMLFGMV